LKWIIEQYSAGAVTQARTPREYHAAIRTLRNMIRDVKRWLDQEGKYRLVEGRHRAYVAEGVRILKPNEKKPRRRVNQTPISRRVLYLEAV
jgi:hypothetical protein